MATQVPLFPELEPRPPTGEQLKAAAFRLLDEKYGHWLEWARDQAAAWLASQPEHASMTSDDVWERWPPPPDMHPSVMGPLFRDRRFAKIGYAKSRRASAHARVVSVYRWRG